MTQLGGKVAVVTGAAGGLGTAICRELQIEGATVIGFDLSASSDRDDGVETLAVDLRSEGQVRHGIDRVLTRFGRIDILVNNAGKPGPSGPGHEATIDEFDDVFATNVRSTWLMTKYCVPSMIDQGGGSIVNMSSMYGLVGNTKFPLYHATKGAVRLMTKADAATYAPHGIRVNSIHPGSIDTGRPSVRNDPASSEYNAKVLARIPMGHRGEPSHIARSVVFLASNDSAYMTGSELVVDGGYTAV